MPPEFGSPCWAAAVESPSRLFAPASRSVRGYNPYLHSMNVRIEVVS